MQYKIDIVVVGAGPAGSITAREAAKNKANVLLIERKKEIGIPVQCAEYIPKLLLEKVQVSPKCIAQVIDGMHVFFPDGKSKKINSPGFMIHRNLFDKELAAQAVSEGALLKTETTGIEKKGDHVVISEAGEHKSIQPRIVIGADGPQSTVGQWINRMNTEFMVGMQYTVPLTSSMRHTEIYFRKEWFGGYGWIFPKKSYAHVGIGVKTDANAFSSTVNKLLNEFIVELEQKGKIKKRPRSKTGGLIPVGGPVESVKGNVLLVGDAAGQTHPITGGGVPQAIICGKIAGKIAANAVQKKKDLLKEYDKKWRVIFEDELMRARRKRMYLELQWNHLDKIIKKCWPGFHEYYGN